MWRIILVVVITILGTSSAGYHDGEEFGNHHSNHIHLGTYAEHPKLPPKVIHVTKTVAVKVPVPYPVKVPYHIPYPVPVVKPYPVQVPKYIKVTEHVPYEPHHSVHSISGEYGGGGDESSIGGSADYSNVQHEEYIQPEQHQQSEHDDAYAGQYSAQQLIYSSPRFGINAFYAQAGGSSDANPDGNTYRVTTNSESAMQQPVTQDQYNQNIVENMAAIGLVNQQSHQLQQIQQIPQQNYPQNAHFYQTTVPVAQSNPNHYVEISRQNGSK